MTRITEYLGTTPTISVELWPPRSEAATRRLESSLERLELIRPSFASITYGAAGSTREKTHDLVVEMERRYHTTAMAHLVCAAHSRAELVEILERYRDAGIENVLALRGDPPLDATAPLPEGELAYASELVELARSVGPFCVAVAAHPAGHPGAHDSSADRRRLADKVRLADVVITQFFYRVEEYLDLVGDLRARGVTTPVIPGIMPITSATSLDKMRALSGSPVPVEVATAIGAAAPHDVYRVGVDLATELCAALLAAGAPGLHFFTMNQFAATHDVCVALGLAPASTNV